MAADTSYALWESPLGWIAVTAKNEALCAVVFKVRRDATLACLLSDFPGAIAASGGVLAEALSQLREYFAGQRTQFNLPLNLTTCSAFGQIVLGQLQCVPYGSQISYGELACRSGSPHAARAVGRIMAGNPFPLIIPCHRVVGSGGRMTGYSGGEGISSKRWLLDFEASQSRT